METPGDRVVRFGWLLYLLRFFDQLCRSPVQSFERCVLLSENQGNATFDRHHKHLPILHAQNPVLWIPFVSRWVYLFFVDWIQIIIPENYFFCALCLNPCAVFLLPEVKAATHLQYAQFRLQWFLNVVSCKHHKFEVLFDWSHNSDISIHDWIDDR